MKLYLNELLFSGTEEEFLAIRKFKIKEWFIGDFDYHRTNGTVVCTSNGQRISWYALDVELTDLFPMDYWICGE